MDKNLEQKIRAYIKGYAKIEETETIYDEIDSYKAEHFSKKLEEPFYIFDKRRDGYYKFSCGEGWYYEGVVFDPKDEYYEDKPTIPEYVYSLKFKNGLKEYFGDSDLKQLMKEDRFIPITADLFAEALLQYIKSKE